jgi:signal transduction histidine kinase/ActR/RegA family two-component response regulator
MLLASQPHMSTGISTTEVLSWVAWVIVALLVWLQGRREPRSIRRVHDLLVVALFACAAIHAVIYEALTGTGNEAELIRLAVPIAIGVAALFFLRQLRQAIAVVGRDTAGNDGQIGLLKAAVTASRDGVMIAEVAPAGEPGPRIVYANPAFERMTGYSAEEAVGLSPSVLCQTSSFGPSGAEVRSPYEDEEEAAAVREIRVALRQTEPSRLELPGRRKDGSRVWVEWQLVPVANEGGRCTHWVAVLRDTTERRAFEEQLRESQKMEAVGQLAGGIAHDFNNLLTVIRGNAEILRENCSEDAGELVDEVRGAAERASGLVRQLLTFGRRQAALPVVVNLNTVVTEMAGMLRRLLGEQVSVETDLSSAPIRTRIDRGQLEQVVMNLAVNARDAMPHGGTLTITTSSASGIVGRAPAQFARLAVSDTGCGMTDEVKRHVFEPFFTTKGPDKGTGLGLATAYSIVTQVGGRIGIDTAPGAGTTFRIDLPWCDDPSPSSEMPKPTQKGGRQQDGYGRSVLLVEDEEAVRKLTRMVLEGCGYAVTEAPDGETASDWLAGGQHIDLLVTDLTMPGIGGRELAGLVRLTRPDVGVVFISGYAPDIVRLDSIQGAVFVAKPFAPADLLKAAAKALGRMAKTVVNSA